MSATETSVSSLLFIDLLGAKAIWKQKGAAGAATAFTRFASLVGDALDHLDYEGVLSAEVESDSAGVLCSSAVAAIRVGIEVYHRAFFSSSLPRERTMRTWIRGVVVPAEGVEDVASLRETTEGAQGRFNVTTLSPVLLDAISMEKSGFRGMRLLVHGPLLAKPDRHRLREYLDCNPLVPVKRLNYADYPQRMEDYEDVLWMGAGEEEMKTRRRRMGTRMRYAARDQEEIQQAAATQVVFDECSEILEDLRRRQTSRTQSAKVELPH